MWKAKRPTPKVVRPETSQPSSTLEAWVEIAPSIPSGISSGTRPSMMLMTPPMAVPP
jgi:hypothetical protein